METLQIVGRVKDVLSEMFPEFKDDICCESTTQKKCFHVGTLENKDRLGEKNHICFCMLFDDENINFIPSIFCSIGRCDFCPNPGKSINVNNLEKEVLEFISEIKVKEFLNNPLEYSEFATT